MSGRIGQLMRIKYTVSEYTSGNFSTSVGPGASGPARSAAGTYVDYITVLSDTYGHFHFIAGNEFTGKIDNVSVTQATGTPGYIVDYSILSGYPGVCGYGNASDTRISSWEAGEI